MKRRWSDGTDTIRLTPQELLLRLCALVPPPRRHLVRYFGVFSAHSRGRFALCGRGLHDPMVVIALLTDERVVKKILGHLGLSTTGPPRAPPPPAGQLPLGLAPRGGPSHGVDPPSVDN